MNHYNAMASEGQCLLTVTFQCVKGPGARKEMGLLAAVCTVNYNNNQGSVGPGATAPSAPIEATPLFTEVESMCRALGGFLLVCMLCVGYMYRCTHPTALLNRADLLDMAHIEQHHTYERVHTLGEEPPDWHSQQSS